MSAQAVVNVCKINASDIQFSEPKRNKQGGVFIPFKYKNQNVQFRFPQFGFPAGCIAKENDNKDGSKTTSYSISASLQGCDEYAEKPSTGTDDISKTYNFLREFQEAVIQAAVANSPSWFGKKRGEESIRDSFNKFLSISVEKTKEGEWVPNGKYPPSLRFKIPVYDGKVSMEVIDENEDDVPLTPADLVSTFGKGSQAKIVASGTIYVIGQGFGVTWKPSYVQLTKRSRQTARQVFKDDQDDDEEAPVPVKGGARAALNDDEEEQQQDTQGYDVDDAPAPAPAPAPTPTIVEIPESSSKAPAGTARRRKA